MAWTYDDETGIYTVAFSELNDLLSSLSDNTTDTPYKLEITGLTASDLVYSTSTYKSPLATVFWDNDTKYVDLSPTTLPSTTTLYGTFSGGQTIVEPPVLPSNVTNMQGCFYLCTKMKHAPVIPSNVTNMESCFCDCRSLTTAPEIPSRVTTLKECFYNCVALTETPTIPTSVTTIQSCFGGCTALITVTNIPQQTTNIKEAFYGCTALKKIYNWRYNSISTNNNYSGDCFTDCNALEQIFIDEYNNSRRNSLVTFLTNRQTNGFFPSGKTVVNMVFYPYTEGFSIAFSNLDNYLTYIPSNTQNTPYKLTITGLSVSNVNTSTTSGSLGYIIKNREKFLDLSLTTLNASQTTMKNRFNGCATLVVPPQIPVNVTDMECCFEDCESMISTPYMSSNDKVTTLERCYLGCFSLREVNDLPPSVQTLYGAFCGCSSLVDFIAPIPETVTNMANCFEECISLKSISKIPNSVTNLDGCFQDCTALETSPVIPNSVTEMRYTFLRCESLKVAPVVPDSVTNLVRCFESCTSLVDVPSLPKVESSVDFRYAFTECSALKRVNFGDTFDLTSADFNYIFNGCYHLQSIYVKSTANKNALITELEWQQSNDRFPSGLVVADIVKFDEKVMKVQTDEGQEVVQLYRFKEQLIKPNITIFTYSHQGNTVTGRAWSNKDFKYCDENDEPFTVFAGGEKLYAQIIPPDVGQFEEEIVQIAMKKGSGISLKDCNCVEQLQSKYDYICKSAGDIYHPFQKKYTEIDVYTSDASNIVIPKENFPKGGVLLICGGAGGSTYRASKNDGNKGGDGQIKRIEIPANPKEDITISSVVFAKTSTDGSKSSYARTRYYSSGSGAYATCSSESSTQYGSDGGQGGKNCTVTHIKNNTSQIVTAYGGGGAGGTWIDIWEGYTDAGGGTCKSWRTYSGAETTGGISGQGESSTDSRGASATENGSYEGNTTTTAKLIIGAYV